MINNWKKRFFTIWTGQAISLLTTTVVQYAIIWHLTAKTSSAAVLAVATLIGFLPMALLSPFIGSFVDRYDRKKIMIVSDVLIALVALALSIIGLFGEISLTVFYIALFIRALGSAFHQPCLPAVTPLIVPESELTRCGGYTQTFQSVSLILGPALAAVLYSALPLHIVIAFDVIGAFFAILSLTIVEIPNLQQKSEKSNIFKETAEGFNILNREKGLYYLILICGLFSLAYIPVSSFYPLMSLDYFGKNAYFAGVAEMLFSVGMLLSGLSLGVLGTVKNKIIPMVISIIVIGISLIFIGILPPTGFILFVMLTFLTGLVAPLFSTLFMVIVQEKIKPEYLGRVIGVSSSMMALACPVGLSIAGLFAEKVGVSNWFIISGIVILICALLCFLIREVRNIDRKEN